MWRNARAALQAARLAGADGVRRAAEELEGLCAARVADLVAPGQVILKLARDGFGVLLPGAERPASDPGRRDVRHGTTVAVGPLDLVGVGLRRRDEGLGLHATGSVRWHGR